MIPVQPKPDDLLLEVIRRGRAPMLLSYGPFRELVKYSQNERIGQLIQDTAAVTAQEKKHRLRAQEIKAEKSRLTARVLYLSDQINRTPQPMLETELENQRRLLQVLSKESQEVEESIARLAGERVILNNTLLTESIRHVYGQVHKDEKELSRLLGTIEERRKELRALRERRDLLQRRRSAAYSFVNGVMGAKNAQRIDEQMAQEEEEDG